MANKFGIVKKAISGINDNGSEGLPAGSEALPAGSKAFSSGSKALPAGYDAPLAG